MDTYRTYLLDHIANVQHVGDVVLRKFGLQKDVASDLDDRLFMHDQSKFSVEEYEPYAHKFGHREGPGSSEEFIKAWHHHVLYNDHHWNHWIVFHNNTAEAIPMSLPALLEMLCDWQAMSIAMGGSIDKFYRSNEMLLHQETRLLIEHNIRKFVEVFDYV